MNKKCLLVNIFCEHHIKKTIDLGTCILINRRLIIIYLIKNV